MGNGQWAIPQLPNIEEQLPPAKCSGHHLPSFASDLLLHFMLPLILLDTIVSQCSQIGQNRPQMSKVIAQLIANICYHTAPCDERNWPTAQGNDHPGVN